MDLHHPDSNFPVRLLQPADLPLALFLFTLPGPSNPRQALLFNKRRAYVAFLRIVCICIPLHTDVVNRIQRGDQGTARLVDRLSCDCGRLREPFSLRLGHHLKYSLKNEINKVFLLKGLQKRETV